VVTGYTTKLTSFWGTTIAFLTSLSAVCFRTWGSRRANFFKSSSDIFLSLFYHFYHCVVISGYIASQRRSNPQDCHTPLPAIKAVAGRCTQSLAPTRCKARCKSYITELKRLKRRDVYFSLSANWRNI
jgi:hypothetical protein